MTRFPLVALGASTLFLQACILSPAMNMDTDRLTRQDETENSLVEMVEITPKLIAQEKAVHTSSLIPQELLDYQPENYRIGPNDALFITVWDHPELTTPAGAEQPAVANSRTVRDDGTLFYPFIGNIRAAGLTLEELRKIIARRLARLIEQPQVDVSVIDYKSQKIIASGAFQNPGLLPMKSGRLTLVQAVSLAGIDYQRADLSNLTLIRDGNSHVLDYDRLISSPSGINRIYLRADDELHLGLNDSRKVFLMGEVSAPRAIPYSTSRMTLSEVLATIDGPEAPPSNSNEVYVIRGVERLETERATVFKLNARSPSAFILADQFEMQPQDVVFVGAASITHWSRFISQLFPSANTSRTTQLTDEGIRDIRN